MPEPQKTRIIIPRDGIASGDQQPRAVYDSLSQRVLAAVGPVTSQRASHVDAGKDMSQAALKILAAATPVAFADRGDSSQPYVIRPLFAEDWFADMTPCGHDVVLGPYPPGDREAALRDEVAWLHAHNIPVCQACTATQYAHLSQDKPTSRYESQTPNAQNVPRSTPLPVAAFESVGILENVDLSDLEATLLVHYRRKVANYRRAEFLQGRVTATLPDWDESDDVFKCVVSRSRFFSDDCHEEDNPVYDWEIRVTFDPGQCSVADFAFARV